MTRIPVPEDYERSVVTVAGTHDHLYGEADVNLDDQRHARHLKLNEATDGTVGVPEQYAEAVADFLGTTIESDAETCQAIKADGEQCGRDLPCPYHSGDDGA